MIALLCWLPLALVDVRDGAEPVATAPVPEWPEWPELPEETDEDLELRFYDITSLQGGGVNDEATNLRLFPNCMPYFTGPEEGVWETDEESNVDAIMEVINLLFDDEFQYEGRYIDVVSLRRIVVRGPRALHTRITEVLRFLDGVLHSGPEITIDVVSLPAARAVTSAFIPSAEVDAWIAQATEHRRYTMQLLNERPSLIEFSTSHPVLSGYQVEIAQGAAIHDPIVGIASFGTRLLARGSAGEAGLFLSLLWGRGELIGEVEARHLRVSNQGRTQDQVGPFSGASVFQRPEVLNRSLALSTFVPHGQALVLETQLGLARAENSEVILIRQTKGAKTSVHELKLAEGGVLTVLDLESLAPQQVMSYGPLLDFTTSAQRFSITWDDDQFALVGCDLIGDTDFVANMLAEANEEYWGVEVDRWLVTGPVYEALEDTDGLAAAQARLRKTAASLTSAPSVVDLALRVSRPGSRTLAGSRLALRSGTSAAVVLGIEDLQILDFEVEVAQEVSSARPLTFSVLDGVALWVRAGYGAGGDLTVEVRGGAHLLQGELDELDLQSELVEALDQGAYEYLSLHERVTFEADASGPWIAVLGNAAESGKDGLRLEIEVNRQ